MQRLEVAGAYVHASGTECFLHRCVPAQVEVARLEQTMRALNKQLGEAEADYLTGTERLAALRREVSSSRGLQHEAGGRQESCVLSTEAPAVAQEQGAAGSAPSRETSLLL
jgi:hypothetical protein